METIQAIVIEDEFHPRQTLIQKIQTYHPEIEVVAQCEDAESGLIEVLNRQPKLLFLDIRLPNKNGLWLADQLQQMVGLAFTPPSIIFTTAFDDSEYMLNAIRLSAIDYLIKPILIGDLAKAIERFKTKATSTESPLDKTIAKEQLLRFKNYGGLLLLHPKEVVYLKADGNYSEIFLANGESEAIFERLGEIERRLPPYPFVRLGKSIVLNSTYVRRIDTRKNTIQLVTPHTSLSVPLSVESLKRARELFGS